MIKTRTVFVAAALLLALAGCGSTDNSTTQPASTSSSAAPASTSSAAPAEAAPKATADPYEVYLKLAPKDAPEISREDAQIRALLGCGQKWAPGTVDAALAEAYADLCKQNG